jgi:integrase
MAIKKLPNGKYELNFYPAGRSGPRIKRVRNSRKECKQLQAEILLGYQSAPDRFKKDTRSLKDLVDLWYSLHGVTLKDAKYRYSRTLAIVDRLGNPSVDKFDATWFAHYRTRRLKEVSVATVNHETRYLRSVFNELIRLGHYHGVNPLSAIRTFKEVERELTFLSAAEEKLIFDECAKSSNTHCLPVARLCLATGARWNEANNLMAESLLDDRVIFKDTKNGRSRVIPVAPKLVEYLRSEAFPVNRGRLFDTAQGAFRTAVKRSGVQLPDGQLTHVLRHTFASRLIMRGVDIVTVQRALGHSDIKVTMRYAHLAPDYMQRVVEHCPLDVETL